MKLRRFFAGSSYGAAMLVYAMLFYGAPNSSYEESRSLNSFLDNAYVGVAENVTEQIEPTMCKRSEGRCIYYNEMGDQKNVLFMPQRLITEAQSEEKPADNAPPLPARTLESWTFGDVKD